MPARTCPGKVYRLSGVPSSFDVERDAVAQRLLHVGPVGNNAGDRAIGVEGDMTVGRIVQVLSQAAEPHDDTFCGEGAGGELVHLDGAGPVLGCTFAEGKRYCRAFDRGFAARHRQYHLAGRLILDRCIELEALEKTVRGRFEGRGQGERCAVELQAVQPEPARLLEQAACRECRLCAEKGAELRGHDACDRPVQIALEREAARLLPHAGGSCQDTLGCRIQRQVEIEVRQRPRSFEGKRHRRPALDAEQICEDPVLRLGEHEIEVEHLRRVRIGRRQRKLPAWAVEPGDVDRRVERAIRQPKAAVHADLRCKSEDALAKGDAWHGKVAERDRQRQLGYAEAAGLGRWQAFIRQRLPHDVDTVGLQRIDGQTAEQQRGACPDDPRVSDAEPDALAVGNRDLANCRVR